MDSKDKEPRFTFISPAQPVNCPMFVKTFEAKNIRSAVLDVTGLGLYRVFLNGQRVGEDWLTPGFNDYTAYLRYRRYDIGALLKDSNRLEVMLGNGWYKGRFGLSDSGENRNIFGCDYMLAVSIALNHHSGNTTVIATDEGWDVSASPVLDSSIYDGEARDDSLVPGEAFGCVITQPPSAPELDNTLPVRVRRVLRPTLLTSPKGEKILDFGQNMTGVVRFMNRLPKGGSIRLRHGEVLQEGCFYSDNLRSAKAEYAYTSDGEEKFIEPYFTFFGFRYVLVEGLEEIKPDDFYGLVLYSDLKETLSILTSHPKINQLMQNTLWGQRGNFLDVPTDCPQRDERLGWTGDAQVFSGTACYQMDCRRFFRKYMRDMREDQLRYYHGDVPMYSPSLRGVAGAGGAAWADAAAIIPWTVYQHYGDLRLLKETYPLMHDYAEKLIRKDLKGGSERLIREGFAFGDWLALDGITHQSLSGGTDLPFIQSMYCCHSILLASLAAEELKLAEDSRRYAGLAEEIKQAILSEYFTGSGRLSVDTQTAYVLALSFKVYKDPAVLVAQLKKRLLCDQFILKTGFVGTSLALKAMMDNGMDDEAYKLLCRQEYPGWLNAVNLGATTIWERWNSMLPDGRVSDTGMNSFNHYANGSVCETIYSRMAGLRIGNPGWASAVIAPMPNWRVKSIDMRFDSPAGMYAVSWRIEDDGHFNLKAEVPQGGKALVILPLHPDNIQTDIRSGQHEFCYMPARSLLYPYSVGSLTQDLMANAGARQALDKHMPGFFHAAAGGNADFMMMSPLEAGSKLPFLRKIDMALLDIDLKSIRA